MYFRKDYLKVTSRRSASAFPAEYRDEKGFWMMPAATLNVIAYNKKMVASADAPKSFFDLTEPRWKGQLMMDENESKWMAGMIQYYGEAKAMDLMRKLAAQEIQFRTGHTLLQTLVAAGERAVVVVAFANGVDRLKKESAPIEWVSAEPAIGLTFGLAVVKDAPHPNAARLFQRFSALARGPRSDRRRRLLRAAHRCRFADPQRRSAEN